MPHDIRKHMASRGHIQAHPGGSKTRRHTGIVWITSI
jgi:hypothetical protein